MMINKPESRIRCAIYARYSSEMQSDNSIDDQIRNCKAFADLKGWLIRDNYIFSDRAVSGKTIVGRPGVQRLVAASESKPSQFEYVLIDDTSRLSRDKVEQATLIRDLRDEGVYIYFVSDNIDTQDETSEDVLLPVYGIKDSLYSRDLAKKTQRGMAGQVLKGFNAGGRLFGYRYTRELDPTGAIDRKTEQVRVLGTRIGIDRKEDKVVRTIFSMYASGCGLKSIAMHLNEQEISPPRASTQLSRRKTQPTWGPYTIRAILHNPKYSGDWTWNRKKWFRKRKTGKRVYTDRPESDWVRVKRPDLVIIDTHLLTAVRRRIALNAEKYERGARSPRRNYILSGLLQCGECGANLTIVRGGRSDKARYGCAFNWRRGKKACTNNVLVRRNEIEQRVLGAIRDKVLNPRSIMRIVGLVNDKLKAAKTGVESEREDLENRSSRLNVEINNLVEAIAGSGYSSGHILTAIKSKESELAELLLKLEAISNMKNSKELKIDTKYAVKWINQLAELVKVDVIRARAGIEQLVGILMAKPVTQNGATGLLLVGRPKLEGILGVVGGSSTSNGSGGRI